jgi:hypothetical protein
MMLAYKKSDLEALADLQLAKTLKKDGMLAEGADLSKLELASTLYNPGHLMRILLFIVGLIGVNGAIGMVFFIVQDALSEAWQVLFLLVGAALLFIHEAALVRNMKHFKTGLSDVVLLTGLLMLGIGINGENERHLWLSFLVMAVFCAVAAIRYINNLLVAVALCLVVAAFLHLAERNGALLMSLLPFIVMLFFTSCLMLSLKLEMNPALYIWENQILTMQAVSLLLVYLGGNYLVVRELGQSINNTFVQQETEIPFAWFFYFLTAAIPLLYLFVGIKWRSRIFIWVGLATAGFSVFTFKFYFSLGHPEITITVAGIILLAIAVVSLNYLKTPKKGITRQRLTAVNLNFFTAEGILISQTMGTMAQPHQSELFKGGNFGGGGASGNF